MFMENKNCGFVPDDKKNILERSNDGVSKVFFNKMFLLNNALFDANKKKIADNVLSVFEHECLLEVKVKNCFILFDKDGKKLASSLKKFTCFANQWYAFYDKKKERKLVNSENEVVITDFEDVFFYKNGWYVVKFNGEFALYDKNSTNITTSNYEIVVDDVNDRFMICYSEDKISVFEKNLNPLVLNVDAFVVIDELYAVKRGEKIEIFKTDKDAQKDKLVWNGDLTQLMSDDFFIDEMFKTDELLSKLL